MRRIAALAFMLALSACATPAERIASKLEAHGIPPREARCMGERLYARLSLSQLETLEEVTRLNNQRATEMAIRDFARLVERTGDPKLVAEVLKIGIGCAL